MKKLTSKAAFFLLIFFVAVSCVTINIYFPAAAVEKAAEDIVEEVWGSGEDVEIEVEPAKETGPQGFRLQDLKYLAISFSPGTAHAAGVGSDADIKVSTPAIRALKGAIHNRSDALKPFLNKGNVGIGNDGLLTVRSAKGLNLKYKSILNRLVAAENKDREALYREIAAANDIGPDKISEIKSLFAKSWIKNARKGWLVQGEDGVWSKK
jgi:uncharacterized protein YdbL (DUF1318 family)